MGASLIVDKGVGGKTQPLATGVSGLMESVAIQRRFVVSRMSSRVAMADSNVEPRKDAAAARVSL